MSIRCIARAVSVASLGLFTVVGSGLMALPAGAAGTTTFHFYSVSQTQTLTDAAGQPITDPNFTPTAGDQVQETDLLYVGNHTHHASSYSASDHIACVITSNTAATCNAQIAIGGSLLLADDVTVDITQTGLGPVQLNAGTGKYKTAAGMVTTTPVANSNNSDFTITLTST